MGKQKNNLVSQFLDLSVSANQDFTDFLQKANEPATELLSQQDSENDPVELDSEQTIVHTDDIKHRKPIAQVISQSEIAGLPATESKRRKKGKKSLKLTFHTPSTPMQVAEVAMGMDLYEKFIFAENVVERSDTRIYLSTENNQLIELLKLYAKSTGKRISLYDILNNILCLHFKQNRSEINECQQTFSLKVSEISNLIKI